jgi:hypothetical protein
MTGHFFHFMLPVPRDSPVVKTDNENSLAGNKIKPRPKREGLFFCYRREAMAVRNNLQP